MMYDIQLLRETHQACLDEFVNHFQAFFESVDYANTSRQIRVVPIKSADDLKTALRGAGFYLIASDVATLRNPCKLQVSNGLSVVYRGHSYNIRERIESHLFYDTYVAKDSGRRFTVCLKLDDKNINLDQQGRNANANWAIVTHSMPDSTLVVRSAAECAFDETFGRPVGSDK